MTHQLHIEFYSTLSRLLHMDHLVCLKMYKDAKVTQH